MRFLRSAGRGGRYLRQRGGDIRLRPERQEGKIPSGSPLTIRLEPLPKVIDEAMVACHPVTVAFKLGWHEEERARAMLDAGVWMVVVNAPSVMGAAGERSHS